MLWMALITVFVLIEKVFPGPPILLRPMSGGLLVGWGLWLIVQDRDGWRDQGQTPPPGGGKGIRLRASQGA